MAKPSKSVQAVRFGVFEVDLQAGELRKSGLKVRIQEQPFQILALLLERPGQVITREDLRERLWPEDTFVDFDHSLSTSINKLRDALGDSAASPRFIETLPRRGYRFIAPVERVSAAAEAERRQEPAEQPQRRLAVIVSSVSLALILGGAASWYFFRERSPEAALKIVPLTTYPGAERQPSFSPDGDQVAFSWNGENQNNYDIYVKLLDAGRPHRLTTNSADDVTPTWSPDGRRIAFYRRWRDRAAVYSVSSLGGSERKLADVTRSGFWQMSWSPDGKLLAFEDRDSPESPDAIFLLSLETGEKRRLTAASAEPQMCPAFSPDGGTLAFGTGVLTGDIYLAPVAGGEPTQLTFDGRGVRGLAWTPDGREIVFSSGREGQFSLWRIPASGETPVRVVALAEGALFPAISPQGRRLVYTRHVMDTNIWRYDAQGLGRDRSPPRKLIASTQDDANPQYSPDGRRIAFASTRSGSWELWVTDSEGENPTQLTFFDGPLSGGWPSWSPDSRQIAFDTNLKGNIDVYVINAEGGVPRALTTDSSEDARPSWSKDGRWIYFQSRRTDTRQIWKMPAEGGSPVQVTKKGGNTPLVSPDGRFVYYAKEDTIWRVPTEGGEEMPVLRDYPRGGLGHWAPVDNGIYFAQWEETGGSLKFLNLETGRVTEVMPLEKRWTVSAPAISPDGRWLLAAQIDQPGEDIMLVENFR